MARLAPGVSLAQANAELATVAQRTLTEQGAEFPEYEGWHLRAVPWTPAMTGDLRGVAGILLFAGLLVLLIACANLTSLMLARLSARRREIAVRYALGAGGWQVTRLLLMESVAVAGAAVVLGLAFASALIGPVFSLLPTQLVTLNAPTIDLRVIGYSAAGAFIAAIVTTLVPAWQARRSAPQPALRDGTAVGGRQRLRSILVVAELTLAVVLLVGASLLLSSYARIQQVDPGFRTDRLLTTRLTLAWERYNAPGAVQAFFREYVERLRALPEVEHAAAASQFPPTQSFTTPFRVEGVEAPGSTQPTAFVTTVTPGYFEVLDVPLRAGRYLDDGDRTGQPTVVVVNEAFANRFLDGRTAGAIWIGDIRADVVGVVANTRNDTLLRPAQPEMFATIDQAPPGNQLFLLVRTTIDPEQAIPAVRRALAALDPDQPLYLTQTMEQALAGSVMPQRIGLTLVGAFAVAALLIACVGVYGVVSYWVTTRTREIGIRVALGATTGQVSRLVARQTSRLVVTGAILGLIGGVIAGGAADALLYQTPSTDPLALGGAVAVLACVGLVAGYLPSRRALKVNPVETLRES
jgi:predicted permease